MYSWQHRCLNENCDDPGECIDSWTDFIRLDFLKIVGCHCDKLVIPIAKGRTFYNNPRAMSAGGLSREKILELFYCRTVETMNLRECCFAFEVLTASGHKNACQRKYKKRLTADGKLGNMSTECDLTCDFSEA